MDCAPPPCLGRLGGGLYMLAIGNMYTKRGANPCKKRCKRGYLRGTLLCGTHTTFLAFFAGQDKICVEGFSSHLCFYRARKLIEPEDIPAFMKEGFEVFRLFA